MFKIPHHASKRGVNLELVEAVAPKMRQISSVGGGGKYNFPHAVSMEAIREAMQPIGSTGGTRRADHQLNIHHTHGVDTNGDHLGTIALGDVAHRTEATPLEVPRRTRRRDHDRQPSRSQSGHPAPHPSASARRWSLTSTAIAPDVPP